MNERPAHGLTRFAGAIALTAALAFVAAGCGGDGSSNSDDGGDAKATVDWWTWNPDAAAAKPYIEAFQKEHPNITIRHRFLQYTEYTNAIRLAVRSNSGPDVFGLQVGALASAYAPLTVDLAPLAEKSHGPDWSERLYATDQLQVDGKQVGMPWMITAGGLLWYNRTLLEDKGLEPPKTLDEWRSMCAKLKADKIDCFVHGAKDAWVNLDVFQAIMNQEEAGAFYDAVAGKRSWTEPPFVAGMTAFRRLFTEGIVQDGATGISEYPDAADRFRAGEAATIALGTWENNSMTKTTLAAFAETAGKPEIEKSVFLPTAFPNVTGGSEPAGLFGGPDVGWAISQRSDVKDAAWTFVDWLTSQPSGQKLMARTLQQPALKEVPVDTGDLAHPELQKQPLEDQADQIANLAGQRQVPYADLETAIGDALSAVAAGTKSPAAALADVETVSASIQR